jgi:hypothetical protein
MKYSTLLLSLFLFSCGSIKIKELKDDYTQPLIGKVKSINATIYEYRIVENDTTVWTKNHLMEFDNNNHLIKEIKTNEDDKTEFNYKYTGDLLTEKTSPQDKNNYKTVFSYDSNQNCIEEKAFNNDMTFHVVTQNFDKHNNIVEVNRAFFGKMNHKTKNTYNYKEKTIISEKSMDTIYDVVIKTKMTFNKKGFITRTETIKGNTPNNFDQYQFDTAGNLLQKTTHYSDRTIKETFSYQNTYDKKGNIIARKKIYNGKLVGKTTFDITYW